MLRTKLFKGFMLVVVLFAVLSSVLAIRTIKQHVTAEAQNRVRLDLSSAWSVCQSRLKRAETIVTLTAGDQLLIESCERQDWSAPELRSRLEHICGQVHLDFLGIAAADGKVVLRSTPPFHSGDYLASDPIVRRALTGKPTSGMALYSQTQLGREGMDLAEKAFFELEDTPHARMSPRKAETRGMVLVAAFPVCRTDRVLGVIYGGILVNRNHELIDEIHNVVYKNETYHKKQLGTATIFLHDTRVATTVRRTNGNRALGTRVSKEVAEQVLDNGISWVGQAFVVRDWYLTAYDPICDIEGRIIGMLYVGILRQPFLDYGHSLIIRYVLLSLFVLFIALALSFILASRLSRPIHRLVDASNRMTNGETPVLVPTDRACRETEKLTHAFNEMAARLAEREKSLKATNRSYMETLGFVAHELKSPIASMLNYVYLLRERKLGALTDRQEKAIRVLDRNIARLVEMVRHYLNLSRIENNELKPVPTCVAVLPEILTPQLEAMAPELSACRIMVKNTIGPDVLVHADLNMTREVFENLLSNAVKYGRDGGTITLRAECANAFVKFAVRNEGEGIPPHQRNTLFQKFARFNGGTPARQKGTGLGLFITKHVVEAHGGSIEVASEVGQWVEMVFTLPRHEDAASVSAFPESPGKDTTDVTPST